MVSFDSSLIASFSRFSSRGNALSLLLIFFFLQFDLFLFSFFPTNICNSVFFSFPFGVSTAIRQSSLLLSLELNDAGLFHLADAILLLKTCKSKKVGWYT